MVDVRDQEALAHLEQHLTLLNPPDPTNRTLLCGDRGQMSTLLLIAMTAQLALPDDYGPAPLWLLPTLEAVFMAVMLAVRPLRHRGHTSAIRHSVLALTVLLAAADFAAVIRLISRILSHPNASNDPNYVFTLLGSGAAVWFTNFTVYALIYWVHDRGGPFLDAGAHTRRPDFLFPQMTELPAVHRDWTPTFVDYAYVSFTNTAAFSPTDTMPLTPWAKVAMTSQSFVALTTVGMIVARAVNILP